MDNFEISVKKIREQLNISSMKENENQILSKLAQLDLLFFSY